MLQRRVRDAIVIGLVGVAEHALDHRAQVVKEVLREHKGRGETVQARSEGGVLFFPESGVVFSHTHSCAFVCMRVHSYAFHCFLHAFRRAAFYKSVAFERILQPL